MYRLFFSVIFILFFAVQGFPQSAVPDNADGFVIDETPLFLKAPRNRLTLTSHYNSISFLVEPVMFSGGVRPNPLPRIDNLTVTFLDDPNKKYTVKWNFVEKINLFHELVFEEFQQLLKQTAKDAEDEDAETQKKMFGRFELLFDYLNFLNDYKKELPEFNKEYKSFLLLEAQQQLKSGNDDAALAKFSKLLEDNRKDSDLKTLASAALDSVLKKEYTAERFTQCRTYLGLFAETLPQETVFLQWKEKIAQTALRFSDLSKDELSKKHYAAAHQYNQTALDIDPLSAAVKDWQKELQQKAPLFRVAVNVPIPAENKPKENTLKENPPPLPNESQQRYCRLLDNIFLQYVKPSFEGGVYQNAHIKIRRSEDGLSLLFVFSEAKHLSNAADTIAELSKRTGTNPETMFARLFESAEQTAADTLTVKFKHRFPLPEALFAVPFNVPHYGSSSSGSGLYSLIKKEDNGNYFEANNYTGAYPAVIHEKLFLRSEEAFAALKDGTVDIVNLISPWETEPLKKHTGITVRRYAVPSVHFIIPNVDKKLTSDRTFRRALLCGLNRQAMLGRILNINPAKISERITNNDIDGAVSSVPFLRGNSLSDPLGYANDTSIRPRQYEPKLAAALAVSAFNRLRSAAENDDKDWTELTSIPALTLSCPANDAAKYTALLIKHQWAAIGVPVRILERTDENGIGKDSGIDFWLVERTVKEPLTEAELIFGKSGLCGGTSPAMELALEKLRSVENWSEAAKALFVIHRLCYEETTVIPLWQIYNYYACRSDIKGITAENGISDLYENIKDWR